MKRMHETGKQEGGTGVSPYVATQTSLKDHFRVVKPRLDTVAGCTSGAAGNKLLAQFKEPASKACLQPFRISALTNQPSSLTAPAACSSSMPFTRGYSFVHPNARCAPAVSDCAMSLSTFGEAFADEDDCINLNTSRDTAPAATPSITNTKTAAARASAAAAALHSTHHRWHGNMACGSRPLSLCSSKAVGNTAAAGVTSPSSPQPSDSTAGTAETSGGPAAALGILRTGTNSRMLCNNNPGAGAASDAAYAAAAGTWDHAGAIRNFSLQECSTGSFRSWLPGKADYSFSLDQQHKGPEGEESDDYADDAVSKGVTGFAAAKAAGGGNGVKQLAAVAVASVGSPTAHQSSPTTTDSLAQLMTSSEGVTAHVLQQPAQQLQATALATAHQVEYQDRVEELVYGMAYVAAPAAQEAWRFEE